MQKYLLMIYGKMSKEEVGSDQHEKYVKASQYILSNICKLKTLSHLKNISSVIIELLQNNPNDKIIFDENPNLFCWNNKTYDISKKHFIERNKYDYVTLTCGYDYTKNKTELNAKAKIRKKKNKEKYWQINNNFNNSEYGFIMNLYSGARLECKKGRNGSDILIPFKFTKESWWQHWLDQKERYGMICPYSKVEMTHIRGGSRGKIKRKLIPTNISRDQVWPSRGYTPDNLIFCTVKFNSNKRSITPDGCQAVIDVHNEMMDRWHTKLCFDKNLSRASVSGKDKNGKSFLSNELDRLRKSIGKKGMKQFYQVAYEQCKRERGKNETQ